MTKGQPMMSDIHPNAKTALITANEMPIVAANADGLFAIGEVRVTRAKQANSVGLFAY